MIPIIQQRNIYFIFSGLLVLLSFAGLIIFGLKPSIDFTGGSLIELGFTSEKPSLEDMQTALGGLDFGSTLVQPVGENAYIIKLRYINDNEHQELLSVLRNRFETGDQKVLENRVETIGAVISSQLKERSWKAGLAVLLAILLYVAFAFRKVSRPVKSWKYGAVAIIALAHDVGITVGVFTVLGHFYGVEVGIPFVVALLTILGYSVNDTIVVFDRIRETLIKRAHESFENIVNHSVNSTLQRSVNTSFTVLLGLVGLYFFGEESVKNFALALIVGVAAGTYSSIFLASPLLVVWQKLSKS
ncbi:MAG: protein translocase subunit SecF [Candidatus Magasanikbacteria bacterium]|nr:protein translocase subunit SecF [Candidatus Magasanikbacteria bacterium]